jgi:pimeloyl-ACP methyl ester carboxylesterase
VPEIALPQGTVRYRDDGDGPPIVFIHGVLVDGRLWEPVADRLDGFRRIVPDLPLGSHRVPMPDANLSPTGLGQLIADFLGALDLHDVTLVGNDTGGALCQLVVTRHPKRIGRLVLTNCDAFETFPPFPFTLLFRLGRHPRAARVVMQAVRSARLRNGVLGFGPLVARPLGADESEAWVRPYLDDDGVRRDTARFLRGWRASDLADVATRLHRFDRPVLLAWAPADRFFKVSLATRLAAVFPDVRLVEVPDARTFVALDQPEVLARHIADFAGE